LLTKLLNYSRSSGTTLKVGYVDDDIGCKIPSNMRAERRYHVAGFVRSFAYLLFIRMISIEFFKVKIKTNLQPLNKPQFFRSRYQVTSELMNVAEFKGNRIFVVFGGGTKHSDPAC